MSADLPDATGYPLERAREMLLASGCGAISLVRVGPAEEEGGGRRTMVVRQRCRGDGAVELTVAAQWRTPRREG